MSDKPPPEVLDLIERQKRIIRLWSASVVRWNEIVELRKSASLDAEERELLKAEMEDIKKAQTVLMVEQTELESRMREWEQANPGE